MQMALELTLARKLQKFIFVAAAEICGAAIAE
jgi:hypothetical protein